MSNGPYAYLCKGIVVAVEKLPEGMNHTPKEWWLKEQGYVEPFKLYNEEGLYLPEIDALPNEEHLEKWRKYNEAEREFLGRFPIPFRLKRSGHCDGDDTEVIITHETLVVETHWDSIAVDLTEFQNRPIPEDMQLALDRYFPEYKVRVWLFPYYG